MTALDGDLGLVVVDIDGVVADVRHRLQHLQRTPKDWDGFFAAMADDPPLPDGVALVRRLSQSHDLCWLTGRPRRYAEVTAAWLHDHDLPAAPTWHRRDGDRRPAARVKLQLVQRLREARRIELVIDDDAAVCDALDAAGVPTLHATWAQQPARLFEAQEHEGRT